MKHPELNSETEMLLIRGSGVSLTTGTDAQKAVCVHRLSHSC